jgi:WD40 repeat protein
MRRFRLAVWSAWVPLALAAFRGPVCYGQEPWAVLQPKGGQVNSVAFSPDGKMLAAACENGTIELWEVATHRRRATLKGHTDRVNSVAFSDDGRLLAAGGCDHDGNGTIRLWDVRAILKAGK